MAAALDEHHVGKITTIDREAAKDNDPNMFQLLQRTGLAPYVEPVFARTTYNWELLKLLEKQTSGTACQPLFDFCFIDGAHTWETDGLAFFLAEKLLKPGGWMLFDDLDWSFSTSQTLRNTPMVLQMPEDERTARQVERVFSLLVRQHPNFDEVRVGDAWGWAHKRTKADATLRQSYGRVVDYAYSTGIRADAVALLSKIGSRVAARLNERRL
jgi:predicted O-methyltransferase YrrM